MDYPTEFTVEARTKIEKERIESGQAIPSTVDDSSCEGIAVRYMMRVFLVFAKEACTTATKQHWGLDRIRSESEKFLFEQLVPLALSENFRSCHPLRFWERIINAGTRHDRQLKVIASEDAKHALRASPEWKEYEILLLAPSPVMAVVSPSMRTSLAGGRPRKDAERQKIREKKAAGKNWKQITAEMNSETGQNNNQEAYRALLRVKSDKTPGKNSRKKPGKNVQN